MPTEVLNTVNEEYLTGFDSTIAVLWLEMEGRRPINHEKVMGINGAGKKVLLWVAGTNGARMREDDALLESLKDAAEANGASHALVDLRSPEVRENVAEILHDMGVSF